MDFIERLFTISPDGGNGLLETFYVTAVVLAIMLVGFRYRETLQQQIGRMWERLTHKR